MKQILFLIPIFLLTFTLAVYPGETILEEHNLGTENLIYTIIENSTVIPELNVIINSTHIEIFFPYNTPVDTFKLIFIEEQTKEVIKEVKVSSGGKRTKIVEKEVNNTIYLNDTRIIEVESECPNCNESEADNIEKIEDYKLDKIIILVMILFLFIIGLIFLWINKIEKKDKFKRITREDNRIE